MTFVRTHMHSLFANPHLVCDECLHRVIGWHNSDACGCDGSFWSVPCGHRASTTSKCPSWSPIDGCMCKELLSTVPHSVHA